MPLNPSLNMPITHNKSAMSSHSEWGSYMSWHNSAESLFMTDNKYSWWTFRDSTDLCMCTHLRLLRDIYKAGVSGAHADKALSGRRAWCGVGCGELNTHTHTHTMNINIASGAVQLLRGRIDTDNAHVWWEILFIMKNTEDKLSHAWETRDTLRSGSSVECVRRQVMGRSTHLARWGSCRLRRWRWREVWSLTRAGALVAPSGEAEEAATWWWAGTGCALSLDYSHWAG